MAVKRVPRAKTTAPTVVAEAKPIAEVTKVAPRRRVVAKVNKQWFLDRLDDMGWSMRKLAENVELDIAAVSLLLDGKRRMKAVEAGAIARQLGVAVDEVLRHAGIDVRDMSSNSVAIRGVVDGQGNVTMDAVRGPRTVEAPVGAPDGLLALRVVDGLMHGWVLFCRETTGIRPEAVGKLCIITLGDGSRRAGWLRAGYAEGDWEILPLGSSAAGAADLNSVVSAALVMWIKQ